MQRRFLTAAVIPAFCALLLSFFQVFQAYAWNATIDGTSKTISLVNKTAVCKIQGAYTLRGQIYSDVGSTLTVDITSGAVAPIGTVQAQAVILHGVESFLQVNEVNEFGLRVINTSALDPSRPLFSFLSSSAGYQLNRYDGDVGAAVYGLGQIDSYSFESNYVSVLSYDVLNSVWLPSSYMGASTLDFSPGWVYGSSNFIGEDGLLYGVPYYDEEGRMAVPDMYRVQLEDGSIGYISNEEMSLATVDYAETPEEREAVVRGILDIEARAIQRGFAEYYGIGLLSYEDALECAEKMRYENGMALAAEVMERGVKEDLLVAAKNGMVDFGLVCSDKLRSNSLDDIDENLFGEAIVFDEAFEEIFKLALPSLAVTIPAYDEKGEVVGTYSFARV